MKWSRLITTVDAHIGGEVGRVLTGGVIDIPGKTMQEKLAYLNNEDDSLRRFVIQEPRGGVDKTTNLLVPPTRDGADVGFIPMEANGCYPMSGPTQFASSPCCSKPAFCRFAVKWCFFELHTVFSATC